MSPENPHQSGHPRGETSAQSLNVTATFCGTQIVAKHLSLTLGKEHRGFSLGTDPGSDLASLESEGFALIKASTGAFHLRFDPSWDGWIAREGQMWSLRELVDHGIASKSTEMQAMEYRIPSDCTIQIQIGQVKYWIRPTGAVQKLGRHRTGQGLPFYRYLLAPTLLFLILLLAVPQVGEEPKMLNGEALIATARLAEDRSRALEEAQRENAREQFTRPRKKNLEQFSTHENPLQVSTSATSDVGEAPPITPEGATRRARTSGFLGIAGIDFGSLVPKLSYDSSDEAIDTYGELRPEDVDGATGAWGHGLRKIGPGSGDGKDWGSVKSKYKMASAKQRGSEYVANALKRPPDFGEVAVSKAADDLVDRGLSYDVIRGQLGLRRRKLRRCFALDETSDYGAPGALVLGFQISVQGEVAAAEVDKVEHPKVRSCVESTLLSIRFPEPSDGKAISVKGFSVRI